MSTSKSASTEQVLVKTKTKVTESNQVKTAARGNRPKISASVLEIDVKMILGGGLVLD